MECGFRTVVSDPEGTAPEAEVYRTTVVRLLMEDPAFGLKQVTDIPMKPIRLKNNSDVKTMLWVTHHAENQLPAVIFTQIKEERATAPSVPVTGRLRLDDSPPPGLDLGVIEAYKTREKPAGPGKTETGYADPPYDLDKFCYYTFAHCRTYILEQAAGKGFSSQSGIRFAPGDTIIMYPTALGGGERVIGYKTPEAPWDDAIRALELGVKEALKTRDVDFGGIVFLSGAREHLLRITDELTSGAELADARFKAEIEQLTAYWKNEIAQKDLTIEAAAEQLRRQKEYSARLEDEKSALREEFALERESLRAETDRHLATIEFLKRRYDQPDSYDGIEAWVREHFSDRLLLHPKAVARMMTRANQCAAVEMVCDALDYLATDYWEMRYLRLPQEIALTRCAEKYGRPFEVKPTGQATIEYTPAEYRIKYFRDAQGRERDSDLDYHLRVGNDPENLLRIYFLHDDEKQLIVVGSLPDHLRAVKIH